MISAALLLLLGAPAWAAPPSDVPTVLRACTDAPGALPGGLDAARKRAVTIETTLGSGSGVFLSPDGFVVTAAHVVGGATDVTVRLDDGSRLVGTVLRTNPVADLALVRVDAVDVPCLPLAEERAPLGSDVFLLGSPQGVYTQSITKGIVSSYREVDGWAVLQTDAAVNPGHSGGVVVGADGLALGIVSFKAVGLGVEGLGFAMAVEAIPAALHITLGDRTDADVPVWAAKDGVGDGVGGLIGQRVVRAPEVSGRPAEVAPPMSRKKACRRAKIEDDPFTGVPTMRFSEPGHFTIRWTGAEGAVVTLHYPMMAAVFGQGALQAEPGVMLPGGVRVELLLEDGTRLLLHSERAQVSGGWLPNFAVQVAVDDGVVAALASSAPRRFRWTSSNGAVFDTEKSKPDGRKFVAGFSCLLSELADTEE